MDGLIQIISTRRLREDLLQEATPIGIGTSERTAVGVFICTLWPVVLRMILIMLWMVVTGVAEDILHHTEDHERSKKGVETILTVSRHISDMTNQFHCYLQKVYPSKRLLWMCICRAKHANCLGTSGTIICKPQD